MNPNRVQANLLQAAKAGVDLPKPSKSRRFSFISALFLMMSASPYLNS
ncbi:hypothetical protein H6G91_38335 [Nostoc muscorum FACHB-395]|nr:hypothetical protein [Desmonostoc muscorum FACHB-395]